MATETAGAHIIDITLKLAFSIYRHRKLQKKKKNCLIAKQSVSAASTPAHNTVSTLISHEGVINCSACNAAAYPGDPIWDKLCEAINGYGNKEEAWKARYDAKQQQCTIC